MRRKWVRKKTPLRIFLYQKPKNDNKYQIPLAMCLHLVDETKILKIENADPAKMQQILNLANTDLQK